MTTTGSSVISALGAGSGIDYAKLASDLAEASFAAQRDRATTRKTTLEAQISAAGQLRGAMSSIASALGDRVRNGDLAPRGELGNSAVAKVAVAPGQTPRGNFSLEVTQLAQGQTLLSRSLASPTATVGAGTLTLRFGTIDGASFTADAARTPVAITVTASDTLASLATKITQSSGGAVTAYVATGTGGAQLVMKGRDGAANGFVLEAASAAAAPSDVAGDLTYLGWTPASSGTLLRTAARDAAFRLDGVAMTSPTNRVSGLPAGFTFDLTATNSGAPTTLSFAGNASAITGVMNDLVAALNDIAGQIKELAAPVGGRLGSDPGARELKRDLAGLAGQVVMAGAAAGEPRTLGDLGLVLERDGTFKLDNARLTRALETSPDAVGAMFTTGASGVFAAFDRLSRDTSLASDPGSLGGSLKRFEAERSANEKKLAKIAEQQEALRERLTREFNASEKRVAASQSTLAFLRQQVDVWSAKDR
ncbi:flagellar filament capping protein FliD [Erythrobacter sp. NE805]|uniref:flagellar filament capping protein FliD n=1 Tax=Erythrobacter sp. NE805 TaxID=3389875 RepID=UPI00396B044D